MTDERFAQLVHRLEREARESPLKYKLRVAGLASVGYLYILGILVILLAAMALVIWGMVQGTGRSGLRRIGSALIVLIYVIVRAMWVRFAPPKGIELTERDAPAFFAEVDAIRKRMRAPRVHRVLLEDDLNAAVNQRPRLGILGWQENTLFIGLPMLQAMSPDQARAVLAHEFGHLSGAHSRFSGWIYRVRETWARLLDKLEEEEHWSTIVFRPFFRWYSPYFDACSFVLARATEFEADAAGATLSSRRDCGDALVAAELKGAFLARRFWPWVYAQAEQRPEPDVTPYTGLARLLRADLDPGDGDRWLEQALALETTLSDTHPSLHDRLEALGVEARVPAAIEQSAADVWLGENHARLSTELDDEWRRRIEDKWRRRFDEIREKEERIDALAEKSARQPLEEAEAWEQACLVEERRTADQALPLYVTYAERFPDLPRARFHAGRMLLDAGDATGIEHLEAAMEVAADAVVPGCEQIADFLESTGDRDRAAEFRARGEAHQKKVDAIEEERGTLPTDIEYQHHGAADENVAVLVDDLRALGNVKAAWLVRRPLELSEEPVYVLAILRRRFAWNPRSWNEYRKDPKKDDLALQDRIASTVRCPGETRIVVLNHRPRFVRRLWTTVPETQILP